MKIMPYGFRYPYPQCVNRKGMSDRYFQKIRYMKIRQVAQVEVMAGVNAQMMLARDFGGTLESGQHLGMVAPGVCLRIGLGVKLYPVRAE